jgi:hypothetical protein
VPTVSGKRTAAETYRDRLARARTMLATLAKLLDAHCIEHVKQPDRWDLVADLAALNERLGEAAAAIERTKVGAEGAD